MYIFGLGMCCRTPEWWCSSRRPCCIAPSENTTHIKGQFVSVSQDEDSLWRSGFKGKLRKKQPFWGASIFVRTPSPLVLIGSTEHPEKKPAAQASARRDGATLGFCRIGGRDLAGLGWLERAQSELTYLSGFSQATLSR